MLTHTEDKYLKDLRNDKNKIKMGVKSVRWNACKSAMKMLSLVAE